MITDAMTLTTRMDAQLWASQMLDGVDGAGEPELENLTSYLWKNFSGQRYGDVRPEFPEEGEFWDIVRGMDKK